MAERDYQIAVIPGDGIGTEVTPEALRVLERLADQSEGRFAFTFTTFPWGSSYYLQTGRMMDEDGLEKLRDQDAIFFGAVGLRAVVAVESAVWEGSLVIVRGGRGWRSSHSVRPAMAPDCSTATRSSERPRPNSPEVRVVAPTPSAVSVTAASARNRATRRRPARCSRTPERGATRVATTSGGVARWRRWSWT